MTRRRSAREVAIAVVGLASLTGCDGGGSIARHCAAGHDTAGRPSATAAARAFFRAVHDDDFSSACRLVAPNFSLAHSKFGVLAATYHGHQVTVLEQDRVAADTASLIVLAKDTDGLTLNAVRKDGSEWLVLVGTPHDTSGTEQPSSASSSTIAI